MVLTKEAREGAGEHTRWMPGRMARADAPESREGLASLPLVGELLHFVERVLLGLPPLGPLLLGDLASAGRGVRLVMEVLAGDTLERLVAVFAHELVVIEEALDGRLDGLMVPEGVEHLHHRNPGEVVWVLGEGDQERNRGRSDRLEVT